MKQKNTFTAFLKDLSSWIGIALMFSLLAAPLNFVATMDISPLSKVVIIILVGNLWALLNVAVEKESVADCLVVPTIVILFGCLAARNYGYSNLVYIPALALPAIMLALYYGERLTKKLKKQTSG